MLKKKQTVPIGLCKVPPKVVGLNCLIDKIALKFFDFYVKELDEQLSEDNLNCLFDQLFCEVIEDMDI